MGAFISLAFGWGTSLEGHEVLDKALEGAGLEQRHAGQISEGMYESSWYFSFDRQQLPMTSRSYQEDGWVATTLDMDEELFEDAARRYGRRKLVNALVRLGIKLLRQLHLKYVFFDEEVEAEIDPAQYNADYLVGITLIADGVPGLEEAKERSDVRRAENFQGGVVLYRRLDPVPHYNP